MHPIGPSPPRHLCLLLFCFVLFSPHDALDVSDGGVCAALSALLTFLLCSALLCFALSCRTDFFLLSLSISVSFLHPRRLA